MTVFECYIKNKSKQTFFILCFLMILVNTENYGKRKDRSVAVLLLERGLIHIPLQNRFYGFVIFLFNCSAVIHRQNRNQQSFQNFLFCSFYCNGLRRFIVNCASISKMNLFLKKMITKQLYYNKFESF